MLTAKDAFDGLYEYTGKLRAVMPLEKVPKRDVPEHIPRPDYANNGASSAPLAFHGHRAAVFWAEIFEWLERR